MKSLKLFFILLIVGITTILFDVKSVVALPPGNCLECYLKANGLYDCRETTSGYITCDKSDPSEPCVVTTECE